MKNKESYLPTSLVVIIVLGFIIVVYFIGKSNFHEPISYNQPTPTNTQSPSRIYKSKNLKFTINVLSEFQVEENSPTVTVKNAKGEIHIDRSGTNFETLEEHLDNLSKLNHFVVSNKENISIDTLPAAKGLINGQKHYFIYAAPWTIYSIFTSSPALFGDLDKIAQSFRYAP